MSCWLLILKLCMTSVIATTLNPVQRTCPVCNTKSRQYEIMSTSYLGSSDLDIRPPPVARNMIYHSIDCCPNCGLCQYNLQENTNNVSNQMLTQFIKSPVFQSEYNNLQTLINNNNLPNVASKYHRLALLQEFINSSDAEIAFSYLQCSWIIDDEMIQINSEENNIIKHKILKNYMFKYRELAAKYYAILINKNHKDIIIHFAIYIDILRRLEKYDECIIHSNKLMDKIVNDICYDVGNKEECDTLKYVISFQINKCKQNDNKIYTIKDAKDVADDDQNTMNEITKNNVKLNELQNLKTNNNTNSLYVCLFGAILLISLLWYVFNKFSQTYKLA